MPVSTDLNVSPYYDDFSESKNYHKILFKPSVAVQVRELNQLQSILQNQIERFGDNIFTKGTIINGCNFQYYPYYPYVKLLDLDLSDAAVLVNNYVGLFAKNEANLVSYVVDSVSGYESLAPDLNTIFVRYLNSGSSMTATGYSNDDILTIYDANNSIFSVEVPVGGTGQGFSNSDSIVFMAAMTFTNGAAISVNDTINDPVSLANCVVVSVNTTAISGTSVYNVRPYANSLSNPAINSTSWTFNVGNTVLINNTTSTEVVSIIGEAATASPVTDGVGRIKEVIMSTQGDGYLLPPYTTIQTANTGANVAPAAISLTSHNYLTKVTVANSATSGNSDATGSGYAFGVSEGVVYQKGFFLYVKPQTVIVSKYTDTPDELSVGFETSEDIINSNIDPDLLDNVTGESNYQAPGADRLQLTPGLSVITTAEAQGNTDFFEITAFSLGQPYLQNQLTSYSSIGDEMARRTSETSGDFVIDKFILSTKTASETADEDTTFRVIIDPGQAYIGGERVKTNTNYSLEVDQGIDTYDIPSQVINLNYGNYITVNELGGVFDFTLGDLVTFYDTAKSFITTNANFAGDNLAAAGTAIGTARLRAKKLVSGVVGTPSAVYQLYIYDINMFTGYNFKSVRSVRYESTTGSGYVGIADLVLTLDYTLNSNVAMVSNTNSSKMIFPVGTSSTKTSANIIYTYNTIKTGNTAGVAQVSLTGTETFPFTATANLTSDQLDSISLIPSANAIISTNTVGSFWCDTASNTIIANSGTPNFVTTFTAGDYIKVFIAGAGDGEIKRVDSVINSTAMRVDSVFAAANGAANVVFFHPKDVAIPIDGRTGRYANVSVSGQLLTIVLNETFSANVVYTLDVPVKKTGATPNTKTTKRGTMVKINFSNAVSNTTGPWDLGQSDIFRLRKVYKAANTVVLAATTTSGLTDFTNEFYIDHNQNPDYYDHGYLYLNPKSKLSLGAGEGLLVQFDHFTNTNPGFFTVDSYSRNNTTTFANLVVTASGGDINTTEIPEMITNYGSVDLIDQVDFRTVVANTSIASNSITSATVNPAELTANTRFGNNASLSAVGFPVPDSTYTSDLTYYQGRVDRVVVTDDGHIKAIRGNPSDSNFVAPAEPAGSMTINLLYIPPYPSITQQKSSNFVTIIDKGIANERYTVQRNDSHLVTIPLLGKKDINRYQPARYSMSDISKLETRISALEYYVALSQTEQRMKNMVIPSSLDGSLNRFKYGFFADNFADTNFADTKNPEYSASFINNEVVAKQKYTNFEFDFYSANTVTANGTTGKYLTLPYRTRTIISQSIATDGLIYAEPEVPDPPETTITLITNTSYTPYGTYISSVCSGYDRYNLLADGQGGSYSELVEANSRTCGWEPAPPPPPPEYNGSLVCDPQTFTLITSTSSTYYIGYLQEDQWHQDTVDDISLLENYISPEYSGRVGWSYYGDGSISGITNYAQETKTVVEAQKGPDKVYFAAQQAFTFTATGLKPGTTHTFEFNNEDQGTNCAPVGGYVGDPLITDVYGNLTFVYYYNSGLDSTGTYVTSAQSMINSLVGPKVATVSAAASSASYTITFVSGNSS